MRELLQALLLALVVVAVGCGSSEPAPAAPSDSPEPAAKKSAPAAPAVAVERVKAEPAKDAEPAPIVDGTPKPDADEEKPAPAEEKLTAAAAGIAELEKILQREARTEEELSTNINDAVASCEKVLADTEATEQESDLANNAIVDLLAQGRAMNLEGFDKRFRDWAAKLESSQPPSKFVPKARFHLIRFDNVDADGKVKPEALDAVNAFIEEFPDQRGMAIRLLLDFGEAADLSDDTPMALKAYGLIKEKFPGHQVIEVIEGSIRRLESVGKEFPFEGNLVNGDKLDPESLKGKVVIVDFWATWCGPCVAEIPRLKKLYEELHDKGLEIVGVSLDDEKAELEAFIEERQIPWPQTFPADGQGTGWEHPLTNKFGISGIPALFLVDRSGKLVSTSLRGDALEARVRELIEKSPEG